MFAKHHYLLLGIISLSLSYVMFTGEQYFSMLSMAGLFVLALCGCVFFLIPYLYPHRVQEKRIFLSLFGVAFIVSLLEYLFNLVPPNLALQIAYESLLVAISTGISIAGIYLLGRKIQGQKELNWYLYAIVGAILISFLAYSVMYIINTVQWNGVDEVAYNYYAAQLFVQGQNPYALSMEPILLQYHVQPTVQLSGIYEFAYDYPAMSFLPFVFLPLFGITNFLSFTYITIFFAIFSAFVLYKKANLNNHMLIPLAAWLVATYALIGVASQYLAVPIFLLLAYLYRQRLVLCGLFMGLGASTIQLTWFAIPFFLIILLKENGLRFAINCAGVALITFLLVNGYFILQNPATVGNIFGLFGLTKLPFYGTNIMQFIVAFYPVPYWYSAFVSMLFFFVMLGLFYFYTNTLKPLLAVVPIAIFFLSWRNITIYGLPFIPILLAIYYWPDHHKHEDILKEKRPILAAVGLFATVAIVVAIAAHQLYLRSASLQITNVLPIISVQNNPYLNGTSFGLIGLRVGIANNFNTNQNVSFYVLSRSPYGQQYFLSQSLNKSSAHSLSNYTLNYQLGLIGQNTQIEVFAFSPDYIYAKNINFTTLGQGFK